MIPGLPRPALPCFLLAAALILPGACASRLTPQEAAAANDAQCRGYGFQPDTPLYSQCRATLDERRAIEAVRPPGSGDPTGLAIYAPPPLLPAPTEAGCMTVPIGSQRYTNCP